MRCERLDLNLLVALDALLSEKSVARAADRICLSPSATSNVLSRLRDYFQDELLVLKGRHMVLTHRGEELIEPVRTVLNLVKTTIAAKPEFIADQSEREITIMASDYVGEVLLARAMPYLEQLAPRMSLSIQAIHDRPMQMLEQGAIDLLITLESSFSHDHPSRTLYSDDYVVMGWHGNPFLAEGLSEEAYYSLGHVTTQFGLSRMPAFEEELLRNRARARRVEVVAPSFLSVPFMLLGSNRIATIYRRLAEDVANWLPIKIVPVPFAMPAVSVGVQWHRSNERDPALLWVMDELARHVTLSGDGLGATRSSEWLVPKNSPRPQPDHPLENQCAH
ncbi:LysR substrate-binding domain-containing protein [Novosphingobium rosa]|uniref:LysR substrate-binding domain-containing protein n=1 Tax=Novosphingobium rosa TaxID=76978 RepID=UPI000831BD36|nr:LysR substrate-binding domain-containing protein [Novosphingobium rosa]